MKSSSSNPIPGGRPDSGVNIDRAFNWVKDRTEDNESVGYAIREVSRRGSLSDLSVFAAALREEIRRQEGLPV